MEKKTVFIVAMVLVIGALATAAFRIVAPQSTEFDGQQWRLADSDADFAGRYNMIPGILKLRADGVLATQEKVLNLLGKPDWESDDRSDTWEYRLGSIEGSSDMRLLEITFDPTNHITGIRVKQEVQSRRADPK
jgi:hypothetical protein